MWGLVGLIACVIVLGTLAALAMTKSGDCKREDDCWDFDPSGEGSDRLPD